MKRLLGLDLPDYFTANPKAKAKEVVEALGKNGIKVTEGLVYAVKGGMKEKSKRKKRVVKAAQAAAPSANGVPAKSDAISMIREVKAEVDPILWTKKGHSLATLSPAFLTGNSWLVLQRRHACGIAFSPGETEVGSAGEHPAKG